MEVLMRPGWFVARWLGLLAFLFLSLWLGTRLAGAQGTVTPPEVRPPPAPRKESAKKVQPSPDDRAVPTTPPGFPFGPPGGSTSPAGAANSGATNSLGFTPHF